MMTLEYKQSLAEVNTILKFMGDEYMNKLPNKLIKFIQENMDYSFVSNININYSINNQQMKDDTRIILSLLYRNYWCIKEEKEELIRKDVFEKNKKERELNKQYDYNNLFKNRKPKKEENSEENLSIIKYKESILIKMINKIKAILKK